MLKILLAMGQHNEETEKTNGWFALGLRSSPSTSHCTTDESLLNQYFTMAPLGNGMPGAIYVQQVWPLESFHSRHFGHGDPVAASHTGYQSNAIYFGVERQILRVFEHNMKRDSLILHMLRQ